MQVYSIQRYDYPCHHAQLSNSLVCSFELCFFFLDSCLQLIILSWGFFRREVPRDIRDQRGDAGTGYGAIQDVEITATQMDNQSMAARCELVVLDSSNDRQR